MRPSVRAHFSRQKRRSLAFSAPYLHGDSQELPDNMQPLSEAENNCTTASDPYLCIKVSLHSPRRRAPHASLAD